MDFDNYERQGKEFVVHEGVLLDYPQTPENMEVLIIPEGVTTILFAFFSAYAGESSPQEIYCPDTLLTIEDEAFAECLKTKKIDLGNSLKTIGAYAFSGQYQNLDELIIPDSVTELGDGAFADGHMIYSEIKRLKLSNSITHLPHRLFYETVVHYSVHIPYSVRTIAETAFELSSLRVTIDPSRQSELCPILDQLRVDYTIRERTRNRF